MNYMPMFDEATALKFQEQYPEIQFVPVACANTENPKMKALVAIVIDEPKVEVKGDETCVSNV